MSDGPNGGPVAWPDLQRALSDLEQRISAGVGRVETAVGKHEDWHRGEVRQSAISTRSVALGLAMITATAMGSFATLISVILLAVHHV